MSNNEKNIQTPDHIAAEKWAEQFKTGEWFERLRIEAFEAGAQWAAAQFSPVALTRQTLEKLRDEAEEVFAYNEWDDAYYRGKASAYNHILSLLSKEGQEPDPQYRKKSSESAESTGPPDANSPTAETSFRKEEGQEGEAPAPQTLSVNPEPSYYCGTCGIATVGFDRCLNCLPAASTQGEGGKEAARVAQLEQALWLLRRADKMLARHEPEAYPLMDLAQEISARLSSEADTAAPQSPWVSLLDSLETAKKAELEKYERGTIERSDVANDLYTIRRMWALLSAPPPEAPNSNPEKQ